MSKILTLVNETTRLEIEHASDDEFQKSTYRTLNNLSLEKFP